VNTVAIVCFAIWLVFLIAVLVWLSDSDSHREQMRRDREDWLRHLDEIHRNRQR
jgi:uncharacterized membrane protein